MRILKVRERNVDFNGNGTINLRYVVAQRFKKNGYTHIQLNNIIYPGQIISGIVWVDEIAGIKNIEFSRKGFI